LWLTETSRQPISQTTWLKPIPHYIIGTSTWWTLPSSFHALFKQINNTKRLSNLQHRHRRPSPKKQSIKSKVLKSNTSHASTPPMSLQAKFFYV
jgi:hypothetical protein